MGSLTTPTIKFVWKFYEVQQDLNPPVINIINDLLIGTGGIKVIGYVFRQTNDEVANKDIDLLVTKDTEVILYDASAEGGIANNRNFGYTIEEHVDPTQSAATALLDLGAVDMRPPIIFNANEGVILEGEDVSVQYRMTSAAGTNQRLYAKIWYLQKEAV